jgi:hypothetical protein
MWHELETVLSTKAVLVGFLQQKRAFKDDEDEDTDGSEEEEERNVKGKKKPKFEKDEQGNIIICEVCISFWLFIFFSIQPLSTHAFASGPFLYQLQINLSQAYGEG